MQDFYQQPDASIWTGRRDNPFPERIHQIITCQALPNVSSYAVSGKPKAIALLGFAVDEGVRRNQGRVGAKDGPLAIRKALTNLAWPENMQEILARQKHSSHKPPLTDFGDIICPEGKLHEAQLALATAVATLRAQNYFPIVLGGGHETAWGDYQGLRLGLNAEEPLTIVNFDAHLDMRPLPRDGVGTSGTPFLQAWQHCQQNNLPFHYFCLGLQPQANTASLFATAANAKVACVLAETIMQTGGEALKDAIASVLKLNTPIYVTFCLDVHAAAYAPGVSAPQALGLPPQIIKPALAALLKSGNVVGFDVVELAPNLDREGQTAAIAAAVIRDVISNKLPHL